MKTCCINLKDHEARGLLDGSLTSLWRPVKFVLDHPESFEVGNYFPMRIDSHGDSYPAPEAYGIWGDDWDIPCPWQPGDILIGREAWAYGDSQVDARGPKVAIVYKATNDLRPDGISCDDFGALKWFDVTQEVADRFKEKCEYYDVMRGGDRSSPTMPKWASRIHREIDSVECVQGNANDPHDLNKQAWFWKIKLKGAK